MRTVSIALATALFALPACKNDERQGLPPASEWHQPTESSGGRGAGPAPQGGMPDDEVHAGAGGMPDDEVHGGGMPQDGVHGGGGAAMGGGGMGGMAPDPNRPIDESKFLEGTIRASGAAQKAIKPGMVLYLSAKPAATPDCVQKAMPAASDKIDAPTIPMAFKLTERNVMMAGSAFAGEFLLCGHLSSTGDASKKVPGDVVGGVKVRVPQKGIALVLDTVL